MTVFLGHPLVESVAVAYKARSVSQCRVPCWLYIVIQKWAMYSNPAMSTYRWFFAGPYQGSQFLLPNMILVLEPQKPVEVLEGTKMMPVMGGA